MFYVPSFICGTLIGGSIAYVFLRKFAANGMLAKVQTMLASKSYTDQSSISSNALTIAAFGAIFFVVIKILAGMFGQTSAVWNYLSYAALGAFAAAAVIYYIVQKGKKAKTA